MKGFLIMKRFFLVALVGLLTLPALAMGDVITQWDFNAAADKLNASTGTGTASELVVTSTFASDTVNGGSSDPNAVGSGNGGGAWNLSGNWPAQGVGSGTAGARFVSSTAGFQDVVISMDMRPSGTASRWLQFQYTTDGTNYVDFGSPLEWATSGHDTWYNGLSFDLTSVSAVNNNPNFGFQLVSVFSPVGFSDFGNTYGANEAYHQARTTPTQTNHNYAGGTWRFDMVTVNATAIPEPTAVSLLGLLSLALVVVRRRR